MFKKMNRTIIAVILMIALVVTPDFAKAKEEVTYDEVIKKADIMADLLTSIYGATSVQYALIDQGEIVVSGNSGIYSKDKTTVLTNTHMYGIGSVSKIYTTVAVMQLVEAGKVKLDTPVTKYIPDFKMADSRYKDITVRMLLNHSSGLMGSSFNNAALFGDNDLSGYNNLLTTLSTQRLKADPGEYSVYCNDGFSLAQLVVEKVSGMSFTQYIRKNISDPLGLSNTGTPQDYYQTEQLAKTYLYGDKPLPQECLSVLGTGGIYSTAEDMCHFAEIFLKDSESKVLSDTSAKAMTNPEYKNGIWVPDAPTSSVAYGLGWDNVNTYPFSQYGIQALVKGGDTLLYHSSLIVLPDEGMAMAVVSSGGASTYNQIFAQDILLKALLAKGSIDQILPNITYTLPVKADMPSKYKEYSGYYSTNGAFCKVDINDSGIMTLTVSSGGIQLSVQKLIYTGDGKFYVNDGSNYVTFQQESNGNIYLFVSGYATLAHLGQIATSEYQAQKITSNPISKEIAAAWKAREGKKYYVINEKYSSQAYTIGNLTVEGMMDKNLKGYYANATIIDENTALTNLQIPGTYGRDLSDFHFYKVGKTEYAKVSDMILISEDGINALSDKASFQIKIASDGYAKWYQISDKSKDKKIKVKVPKNASFSVYKSDGTLVYNSWISESSNVTLPAGGHIVFAGNAGAKFTVRYIE